MMTKKYHLLFGLIIIALTLTSCNLPSINRMGGGSYLWATPNPNATPTPTPFQPGDFPVQEGTQEPIPTSGPIEPLPTPTEEGLIIPKDQINILVLGSDMRNTADFRTDVILLVSISPSKNTVSTISFPRDLYVQIPGWGNNRLNTSQEFGGFPLTQATFQANFGFTPDYYILTNFYGFVSIVDSLGGIDVNAAYRLSDTCKLPQNVNGFCTVGPGLVHMDGQLALWYVRSRYSTSDFDRTRRAQEVIQAIFNKLMSLNAIPRLPELYQAYRNNVDMNLPLDEMVRLAPVALQVFSDTSKIHQYFIGPSEVYPYIVPDSGANVLLPNNDAIQIILQRAFNAE
ncbi:MAG TPA: LCP family protein [Anaerolineaceae bacterium]|nr:LCP family protein [Anaerolineaceae bacterium]